MRSSIRELLEKTIVFKYSLPYKDLNKIDITANIDYCYKVSSNDELSMLIYNGIVEYALGEKHVDINNLKTFQKKAIISRLRFDREAKVATQLNYGFYGEVVLDLILQYLFSSKILLAKGYFYNPLEDSETKGYDAYQFYIEENRLALLLGEVKFRGSLKNAISSVLKNLSKATSEKYFNKNVLALINEKNNFDNMPEEFFDIIERWENNPDINLYNEVMDNNIKLYYPIMILYDSLNEDYDETIKASIDIINKKIEESIVKIEIQIELYFILIPVENTKEIKETVVKCVLEDKPVV